MEIILNQWSIFDIINIAIGIIAILISLYVLIKN
jgi:hypothetical protein